MSTNRNLFLESLHFSVADTIEEYGRYYHDYRKSFFQHAFQTHMAIREAFPELDFHTICRIKSFDSTLNKARNKTLDKIYDIHGMKHILHSVNGDNSEELLTSYCYLVQTFLEGYYSQLDTTLIANRTKDYIASPKENGYQAIHLSGIREDHKFEEQIKTAKMEDVAKYGNANHAEKYKPRSFGKHALAQVPLYAIIRDHKEQPEMRELTLSECFQYYYNIPYEDYLQHQAEEREEKGN